MLTTKQAAALLDLSYGQMCELLRSAAIPAFKESKKKGFKIREEDLAAYLLKRKADCQKQAQKLIQKADRCEWALKQIDKMMENRPKD